MKLNLGEGPKPLAGYIGVDRKNGQEAYPLAYPDNAAEVIYASHLLEHFTPPEIPKVLAEWVRVLEPGGVLKIAVPDFAKICAWYQNKQWDKPIHASLMGGQTNDEDFHRSIFDENSLRVRMQQAGLVDIKPWRAEITDCASLEVSLNLQGTKPAKSEKLWPSTEAFNRYSQFGEDGILNAVFNRLNGDWKKTKGYCVDVGAADGLMFSNVRQFIEAGWSALLIESDAERFAKLAKSAGGQFGEGYVKCFNYRVEPSGEHSLDSLLAMADAPEIDLLSIDIDGQDYYIFNSLLNYHPRVVVCEYAGEVEPMFIPQLDGEGQAGWQAIVWVGAARGYIPIARTHSNLIFVRRNLIDKLGIPVEHLASIKSTDESVIAQLNASSESSSPVIQTYEEAVAATSSEEAWEDGPVKIHAVASVPRLGFNATWHCALSALMKLQIPMRMAQGVYWGDCLTRVIEQVIADGAEFVLTIDYDSVFDERHIIKLCQLAMLPEYQCFDAFVPVQMKREAGAAMFQMNGERDFSRPITRISSGHFGLTLIRTEALLKMPKPWFQGLPNAAGTWGEGRVDADLFFWKQFARAGCAVGLANEVRVGHLELGISWPLDHERAMSQSLTEFQTVGQPVECGGDLRTEFLK